MKEWGDRRNLDLYAERRPRRWLARLFGCRAVRQSMIKNENTGDPVREKPAASRELNSRDQDHGPADLGKAELWASRLLSEYWDGKFPVDPNSIAVKMGMEVYFAPIPGGLAGVILKTKKKKSRRPMKRKRQEYDEEEKPKIVVDSEAITSRKRFRDSDPPNQKIPGCFGFSDESMVSDEKILGGIMPIGSRTPDQSPRELFADYFACCLLIPEDKVLEFINKGANINDVATYFGVSAVTIRNRLNDLGVDL